MGKKRKKLAFLVMLLVVFAILISLGSFFASALGVTPARKIVDFQPDTDIEIEFEIINSERNSFETGFGVTGEIADIVFFEQEKIMVNSEDHKVPFTVIIRFPLEMEPGVHKGRIEINPVLPKVNGNVFVAYIAPQIPLLVRVPYPSKYADIRLSVLEVDEGTPVPIYLEFDNLGSEDIMRAGGQVKIKMPDGEELATLTVPDISVRQNSLGKTQAKPSPILRRGVYNAEVDAYYDGVKKTILANFSMGNPIIRIRELETTELALDQVNKIIFKAYNDWNTDLSVKGFVEISGRQEEMPIFDIEADEEREVEGFFDSTGFGLGDYNMSITLIYAKQITTDIFPVKIIEREALEEPEKLGFHPLAYVIGLLIIVLILIIILLIIKKKKTKVERNL